MLHTLNKIEMNNIIFLLGEDWFNLFIKKNGLALRKPEATSLARQTAFNKHVVEEFYTKLSDVYARCVFL